MTVWRRTAHYGEEDREEAPAERLGGDVAISCRELGGGGEGDGSGLLLLGNSCKSGTGPILIPNFVKSLLSVLFLGLK